ncbi:glucosamine-6-phosphate isomerase [Paenibacillus sp. HWE-109]|uniref:glucosamine-6-phosphate isomerase n=1 Tax=Paenibacillus sp. HWE-109 TaxID=1306526 RepID=UPI001EE14913|nr:glucosamine-6-phosphate isomerase [Paenibacillus sp. HWE-109]UKS28299.1 glucosamine-6-phosphate isomerase [Paenibacillus sp. HWE-109]
MDFLTTVKGSLMDGFFPQGWDLRKIDDCCVQAPETITDRQSFWHHGFNPVVCHDVTEFDMKMGHEIAKEIRRSKELGQKLAIILPVGPMGMYKWAVYFLQEWNVDAHHVYGFNMDEWSDCEGNTLDQADPGSFQYAMEQAFYGPLGPLTVPVSQRNFATKENLPTYLDKITELKGEGARLIVVFGIGRMCHIAFWEPHFAAEYESVDLWRKATHRLGAKLHPLTIEQNAITSFKSRTTLVPCYANTIGPGLFLIADQIIGGCDGIFGRGMQWQGMSLWTTLRYGPDPWIPSTYMPTLPGKLFFMKDLAGPLVAECN